ncbi:molybdopterin oxidoreductase [Tepiditoga spiralis]|uniref:Molybdopterin oxidoreductase n=1 Tax=Tepiditoga spiralis TaxID=2108365 RepID=A0A7G1G8I2_9BACT|nr:DUF1667 domain-containing protein [Tepiditoga spiralis]BBE31223.1 molybdopterin oxidoreductase [Tepiditoga spiralis]
MNLTCIVCPNGCMLEVSKKNSEIIVSGNLCKRGYDFAVNELNNPVRTICTTVRTTYKNMSRLPVRTSGEVPKPLIFDIMSVINKVVINEPVSIGDIIIENVLNTGVDIIATSKLGE